MKDLIIRRAPSGKVYVVWHGHPICDEDGGLRYFDTEEEARDTLASCDLVLSAAGDVTPQKSARSLERVGNTHDLAYSHSRINGAVRMEQCVGSTANSAEEKVAGDFSHNLGLLH